MLTTKKLLFFLQRKPPARAINTLKSKLLQRLDNNRLAKVRLFS